MHTFGLDASALVQTLVLGKKIGVVLGTHKDMSKLTARGITDGWWWVWVERWLKKIIKSWYGQFVCSCFADKNADAEILGFLLADNTRSHAPASSS
jgi:hypothetical protein